MNQKKANTRPILLWVDDEIEDLEAYVVLLEKEGFDVRTASSTPQAEEIARGNRLDLALVDLRMPPPDGIECLRLLHKMDEKLILAALSSYHYLNAYQDRLRNIGFPVEIMDKHLPPLINDGKKRFLNPIISLQKSGVTTTMAEIERLRDAVANSDGDAFGYSYEEFQKLPLQIKDKLRIQAMRAAQPTLDKAFGEGYIWVMLCGASDTTVGRAKNIRDVPDEKSISEFGMQQNRPVFQFFKPTIVDDLNWSPCSTESKDFYPTVTLAFDTEEVRVHFDTGSPYTHFSYEELLRLRAISPTDEWSPMERVGFPGGYFVSRLFIEVQLRDQSSGDATKNVKIIGHAVRDWEKSPYARFCGAQCGVDIDGIRRSRRLCPGRQALVGRNLLLENAIVISLNGATMQSSFSHAEQ